MDIQKSILDYLRNLNVGASSTEIADHLNKSRITVTKNLEVMKARGLIDYKKVGMAKLWFIPSGRTNILTKVAYSDSRNERKAAESISREILKEIEEPTIILIFSSTHIDPKKFFRHLKKKFSDKVTIIGCSTCGEISKYGMTENSIVALALKSDHISVGVGIGKNLSKDGYKAGKTAAETALSNLEKDVSRVIISGKTMGDLLRHNMFFAFVFPDFMSEQEENALEGIFTVFGNRCPILGGGSGDNLKYKRTYQFYNGEVYTDSILVALFASDCKTDSISVHGWYPTEKSAFVNKAKGRIVYELDHRRASEVYAEMIGMKEEDLIKKRKIAVVENAGSKYVMSISDLHGNTWLKHPNQVYKDGSMSFFANVPENVVFSLNEATKESVISATESALKEVRKRFKPRICIIFYAIGRKKFLEGYNGCEEEFRIIKKYLDDVEFIGFFAFGQQGFTSSGVTGHRNQTVNFFFISDELFTNNPT